MNNLTPKEKRLRTRQRRKKAKAKGMRIGTRTGKELVDGIEYKRSKLTGEWLEFCRTPEAKGLRRLEVWQQAKGDCQGCGHSLGDPEDSTWEWHHAKFKSQQGDDSLSNAQALCRSCHRLAHGIKVTYKSEFVI